METNALALDVLGGASKLEYKLSLLRDALCSYHCLLDDDKAGRDAAAAAKAQGLLVDPELSFTVCIGMNEAEFEDMLDPKFYAPMVKNSFGVLVDIPKFRSAKKWSDRMAEVFRAQGKQWNDAVKTQVKGKVAALFATSPEEPLLATKRTALDALVTALETRLRELASARSE